MDSNKEMDRFYMAWTMFQLALENKTYTEDINVRIRDWIAKAKVHDKYLRAHYPEYFAEKGE
jgi:hypothetical protein